MKHQKKRFYCTLAIMMCASNTHAADIQFNGFLSAGAVKGNQDDIAYASSVTDKVDFQFDNVLGLQPVAKINDDLSIVAQWVADGRNDYELETDWAFARYQLGDGKNIRIGRLRLASYMLSDHINVGLAYPWIRPPDEVYKQVPFDNITGLDFRWQGNLGKLDLVVQPFVGNSSPKIVLIDQEFTMYLNNCWGLNLTTRNEFVELRLGFAQGKIQFSGVPAGYQQIQAGLLLAGDIEGAEAYNIDEEDTANFAGIGINVEWNNLRTRAEFTQRRVNNVIADTQAWYGMVGYQLGKWLPHITYSTIESTDNDEREYGVPALDATAKQFISEGEHSTILGVRYDIHPRGDVKFELQRTQTDEGINGVLNSPDSSFNMIAIATDWTF
jgi:hypothetical protein